METSTHYRKKRIFRLRKAGAKTFVLGRVNAFEINEVGQFIFESLDGSKSVDDLITMVAEKTNMKIDEIKDDIIEFIEGLKEKEVIEVA